MRFIPWLSLALLSFTVEAVPAQDLKIAYTGQLMGYYRDDVAAPAGTTSAPNQLLTKLQTANQDGFHLILGMGDNFAPEYGASLAWQKNPLCPLSRPVHEKDPLPYPRALYKTDFTPVQSPECDNVASFLMRAGYRALVPGKEDFIYGSFWLSSMARSLARESKEAESEGAPKFASGDNKMHLLAANLRMQLTDASGKTGDKCPLLFSESKTWDQASPCNASKEADSSGISAETLEDIAYTQTKLGGSKTLIVGVVAQNLLDAISSQNKTFLATTTGKSGFGYASYDIARGPLKAGMIQVKVMVTDPLKAVVQTIRQATKKNPGAFASYIVMAQMTRGEAEELAAKLERESVVDPTFPRISLVLSGAYAEQSSRNYSLSSTAGPGEKLDIGLTPVLTPHPAYDSRHLNHQLKPLLNPLSTASLSESATAYTMTSQSDSAPLDMPAATDTSLGLLVDRLQPNNTTIRPNVLDAFGKDESFQNDPATLNKYCSSPQLAPPSGQVDRSVIDRCNVRAMQYLLAAMRDIQPAATDVAFLERRDFFFGTLPPGYTGYEMCEDADARCKLQVALDRILWKGDYLERVMVTGADMSAMISASDTQSSLTSLLQQPTTSGSWLETFGLVKSSSGPPATPTSETFAIPADSNCESLPDPSGGKQSKSTYCIDSKSIELTPQKDGGVWVVTSDHLASDTTTYPALSKLPSTYHLFLVNAHGDYEYVTEAITQNLYAGLPTGGASPNAAASTAALPAKDPYNSTLSEAKQQQRTGFQMDVGKIFFGYLSSNAGANGDNYIAENYQGATDSRASAVSQFELDAEAQLRGLWTTGLFWPPSNATHHAVRFSSGFQTDVEYDRSTQGNLNGAANNASYGANNWAIGPLFQFAYPVGAKPLFGNYGLMRTAQWSFVFSPQFQRQVRDTNLYFAFSSSSPKTGNDELTVPVDYSYAWNVREGLRFEAASPAHRYQLLQGSYLEVGLEQAEQHHVLSGVQLSNPATASVLTCLASSFDPISSCVSTASKGTTPAFPISGSTVVSRLSYADEPADGLYWDISMKWNLHKSVNNFHELDFVAASKGDAFVRRSARDVLSTQTLYDVPLNLGVTFQVLPNLSFAPSGNFFFFNNQIAERQLLIRGFNISMRWYYDRDSHVPFYRQLFLLGPASQDQTRVTKMKQ